MNPTPTTPPLDFVAAFNNVEAADKDYVQATGVVTTDTAAVLATQTKLATQQTTLDADTKSAHDTLVARNAALKSLSDAALASVLPE